MDILAPELTSLTSYLCNNNMAPPSAAITFITYCMMGFVHSLYCPSPPLEVASKGTGTLILGPYSILFVFIYFYWLEANYNIVVGFVIH